MASNEKKHAGNEKDGSGSVIIPTRELRIAWASDESQWKIKSSNTETSFAEAIQVMWFEVEATYTGAKAGNKYKIGFNIRLKPDAFGWDSSPVFMMAKVGVSGSYTWKRLNLNAKELGTERIDFPANFEIDIPISTEDTTLQFGLYEIWGGRWKRGLEIHHAFVNKV